MLSVIFFFVSILFSSVGTHLSAAPAASAKILTYKLDPSHSRFEFRIKHLMIATVTGNFKTFQGEGTIDPKTMRIGDLSVSIDPASIDTNEPDRDKDLRSANFFDVEKFKDMNFKFKNAEYKNKVPSKIYGLMTMHGITKPLTLDIVDWGGTVTDPWGNEKLAFEAEGKLDRTEYNLTWNKLLSKAAGVMVGNEVKIHIYVEAIKSE
jgi:polyisoprenoid-binding protein YceI